MKNKRVLLLLALLAVLPLGGCDLFDDDDDPPTVVINNPVGPTAPTTNPLVAGFGGRFVPVAAADDGICRLILTNSSTGGATPYGFQWTADTLANASNTRQGYPNTGNVSFTFPPTFGAAGGPPHFIQLVVTDNDGSQSSASASEPINCTGTVEQSFTGG